MLQEENCNVERKVDWLTVQVSEEKSWFIVVLVYWCPKEGSLVIGVRAEIDVVRRSIIKAVITDLEFE